MKRKGMGKVGRQNWSEKLKNGKVGKEIKSVATLYTPGIARYLMTHLVDGSE